MDFNDKTLTLFKGFINDIIKVFPEHKECIHKNYDDILNTDDLNIDENEIIKEFLDIIDENSDSITNKDSKIFTDELYLIREISMKSIWDSGISNKTKGNIWKYLQSFCLINISKNSNDQINEVLKSIESKEKIKDKKTLKDMKKIKKINENLKNASNVDDNSDNNGDSNGEELNDMDNLINNTSIGNLAKEITDDLNLGEMGEDGLTDFMKPENMMNIFQKINSTLTDKINSKELDGNALLGEASGIMDQNNMMKSMMGMFGNIVGGSGGPGGPGGMGGGPDLSNMMNMFQGMNSNSNNNNNNNNNNNSGDTSGNHDPNVVRERLRNKLNNKNK